MKQTNEEKLNLGIPAGHLGRTLHCFSSTFCSYSLDDIRLKSIAPSVKPGNGILIANALGSMPYVQL